jgi:hypothetical protein
LDDRMPQRTFRPQAHAAPFRKGDSEKRRFAWKAAVSAQKSGLRAP